MGKTLKKILCTLLVVVMCLTAAPLDGFVGIKWPKMPEINFGEIKLPEIDFSEWFSNKAQAAETLTYGDFLYVVNEDDTITIAGYTGINVSVVIPDEINEKIVTQINKNAFKDNKTIYSVVIPNSIYYLGYGAFRNCTSLTFVRLSKNAETGEYSGANSSYPGPFYGCKALKTVEFAEGTTTLNKAILCNTGIETIKLPETLTTIEKGAFAKCTSLKEINLPDTVTYLGYGAFEDCTSLEKVRLSKDVQTGEYSGANSNYPGPFYGCSALKTVEFAEGTTTLNKAILCNTGIETIKLPETLTTIEKEAFAKCTSLKEINLPDSVTYLGYGAFENCTSLEKVRFKNVETGEYSGVSTSYPGPFYGCKALKTVEFAEGTTTLNKAILCNTGIETIKLPETLTTIEKEAFAKCTSLKEINLPDSVTYLGYGAFENCTSLEKVRFKNVETGEYSGVSTSYPGPFYGCKALKTVEFAEGTTTLNKAILCNTGIETINLPETLTTIEKEAFAKCTSLKEINLPDSVTYLGYGAFENCTSLEKVRFKNVETGEYSGVSTSYPGPFYGCSALKTVEFAEGTTTLNKAILCNTGIETINLPETVTNIGVSAFENCLNLKYIIINNPNCTIEKDAFDGANNINIVCHLNSLVTVYAIQNDIPYTTIEEADTNSYILIDRTNTRYFADINSVSINGYINFTVDYKISDDVWADTSNRNIIIKVPAGTTLVESSLRFGENIITNYTYKADTMNLTIPVSVSEGTIKFSAKAVESRDICSYALFSCRYNKATKQEVIGVINEGVESLTVYTDKITSSKTFKVEGAAPAQTDINIYVDGVLNTTVKSNKVGAYLANIALDDLTGEQVLNIKVSCTTSSGESLNANSTIKYSPQAPELTGFVFYIDSRDDRGVDLFAYAQKGIRPSITHTGSKHPYKFVITYSNPESIESLYVTSTRNNVKKSIPAIYDEETGTFIAHGYFDENNKTYVPGALGLEYTLAHKEMLVGQEIDFEALRNQLSDDLLDNVVVNSTPTEVGSKGTIDFSNVSEELANLMVNYSIDVFDESAGTNLGDMMSMIGVVENIFAYTIPGVDDSKYWVYLDMRDPENILMVIADATDIANTAVQMTLSATEFNEAVGGLSYVQLDDLAGKLSNYATIAGLAYEAYGIYSDHNDLCDQIMQSSTIEDKGEALKKAEELKADRLAFLLLSTMLPIIVATGPMSGPALVFAGMIGIMTALSGFFWDYRIADILGGIFNIRWHIDPSGYVYDIASNERLAGVTTTAYCIEYDESDDFWNNKPADNEYGYVWNAAEYSQENPLITDSEGRYAWDVPEGWWRVKYEKDGYETTWSEWLPVPPPQLEVNIGMTTTEAPEVKDVVIAGNTATVEFTQYVDVSTVNATNIIIKAGNSTVNGTWSAVDAEEYVKDTSKLIARRFVFTANSELEGNYSINIDKVINYAGIAMKSAYNKSEKPDVHEHSYTSTTVPATCTSNGKVVYTCSCNYSYIEVIPAIGHSFTDGQSKCNNCDYNKADSCGCNCHKGGISKIIFKIILIFQKILKKNKQCTCGVYHY